VPGFVETIGSSLLEAPVRAHVMKSQPVRGYPGLPCLGIAQQRGVGGKQSERRASCAAVSHLQPCGKPSIRANLVGYSNFSNCHSRAILELTNKQGRDFPSAARLVAMAATVGAPPSQLRSSGES
jgi:hypothetical protein